MISPGCGRAFEERFLKSYVQRWTFLIQTRNLTLFHSRTIRGNLVKPATTDTSALPASYVNCTALNSRRMKRFAACSIFYFFFSFFFFFLLCLRRIERSFRRFVTIALDEGKISRLLGMENDHERRGDTLSLYGQTEKNCKKLREQGCATIVAGHRFPTTIWLPNKFCPPVRKQPGLDRILRCRSRIEETVSGLARPIDYALIDYVTRDFVVGGINRSFVVDWLRYLSLYPLGS